jgi:alpha-galactosidase
LRFIFALQLVSNLAFGQFQKKHIALTPPLGWNTWNTFHCDVNENLIMGAADAMVSSGMKDAGYEYVVIDDCWQIGRDSTGRIVADPERFPSGIKALADYVHSKGLKFGIYSDAGTMTCARRPGSLGYEKMDAQTYSDWGVDYLKFDWCYTKQLKPSKTYPIMGVDKPWLWAAESGHLWRTTGDITPHFNGRILPFFNTVTSIIDRQAKLYPYAKPGAWNDPDMLEVGNGLSQNENRAHFSMWCMMAAPLMAGNDIRTMSAEVTEILTNKEMIAIDQDPLGKQGQRIIDNGKHEIWVKELSEGGKAICFFNRSKKAWTLTPDWNSLGIDSSKPLRDVWKHADVGEASSITSVKVEGHDVVVYRVR